MTRLKTGTNPVAYPSEISFRFDVNENADTTGHEGKFEQFISSLESLGKGKTTAVPTAKKEEKNPRLFIKNMVSSRCIIVVKAVLENLGLHCLRIELGEVEVSGKITEEQRGKLKDILLKSGLELIGDKKEALVEKIKNALIEMVHYSEESPKLKTSYYLSEKLNYDYTYLANVFSEITNTSIRQFIITHKIERVKELLTYENLTLSEIAYKLNYSSVAYLSNQFKKNAGQMPSHFKKMKGQKLIALELVQTRTDLQIMK